MPRDIFYWSKWSPHVGNAVGIISGIPFIAGLIAAAWAFLYSSKNLENIILLLVAFTMIMWSYIGLLWLSDRRTPKKPVEMLAIRDCSWSLSIGQSNLIFDPGNGKAEWTYTITFYNTLHFPIRVKIDYVDLKMEKVVGNSPDNEKTSGFIIPPKGYAIAYIGSFDTGMIIPKRSMSGSIHIIASYGHPEDGYSRSAEIKHIFYSEIRGEIIIEPKKYPLSLESIDYRDTPIIEQTKNFVNRKNY